MDLISFSSSSSSPATKKKNFHWFDHKFHVKLLVNVCRLFQLKRRENNPKKERERDREGGRGSKGKFEGM